jgi:PP-loop superfamily ATP-utilizing enzyme
VPSAAIAQLCQNELRAALVAELTHIGFKYITLDLEGFHSGSQNRVLENQPLRRGDLPLGNLPVLD